MSKQRTDATIVTTQTVTHVVDCGADDVAAFADVIAKAAEDTLRAGYREHVLYGGHPDDISVSGVQVFLHDEQNARRENNAQRSERAEGGAQ